PYGPCVTHYTPCVPTTDAVDIYSAARVAARARAVAVRLERGRGIGHRIGGQCGGGAAVQVGVIGAREPPGEVCPNVEVEGGGIAAGCRRAGADLTLTDHLARRTPAAPTTTPPASGAA